MAAFWSATFVLSSSLSVRQMKNEYGKCSANIERFKANALRLRLVCNNSFVVVNNQAAVRIKTEIKCHSDITTDKIPNQIMLQYFLWTDI